MSHDFNKFPSDFIWAAGSAAYQIEGASFADGRGKSTWDDILDVSPGNEPPSCESYRLYKEDIKLLKQLEVTHYRFSISWSRILPKGTGDVNEKGVKYYLDLITELKQNGIEPIVTLFHADWPLCLYDAGGWLKKESIDWYIEFCRICFQRFGHLVKRWITFNELPMHAFWGIHRYDNQPRHAPSRPSPSSEELLKLPYVAAHNMILAHAHVYRMYHKEFKVEGGSVGIVIGGHWCEPYEGGNEEVRLRALDWLFNWSIEPIFGKSGEYPRRMREILAEKAKKNNIDFMLPEFTEEEKKLIIGSADFLGINYYTSHMIKESIGALRLEEDGQFDHADSDWEKISGEGSWVRYYPTGLVHLLQYVRSTYGDIPVLITENGCMDRMDKDEKLIDKNLLEDEHRVRWIEGHIDAIRKGLQESLNIIGYTAWSLIDNLEWSDGIDFKFGLFSVDFDSSDKKRTAKKSAKYYANQIRKWREETLRK